MRFEGKLAKWNEDRGFGFIQPTQGGQELFAHISAFPRDGQRPQLHESLSFEVAPGQDGKKQAVAIQRPHTGAAPSKHTRRTPEQMSRSPASTGVWGKLVALLLVCAVLGGGYWKYNERQQMDARAAAAELWNDATSALRRTTAPAPLVTNDVAHNYRCDGRQHCSQMTSCAEATFFLKNCPNTKMDGDMDGIPCEVQWCH